MKKLLIGIFLALALTFLGTATVKAETYDYDFITLDNGMQGLWATDYFHSEVTITPATAGCYNVVRKDEGTFEALPGAKSPGGTGGTLIGAGTKGTISGGLTLIVCGTLNPEPLSNDEPEDLRGFVNNTGFYAWKYFHRYFNSITGETWVDWGWTFSTCNNGTWVDNATTEAAYPTGTLMGDITGTYVPCSDKDQCKKEMSFTAADSLYYNGLTPSAGLYATGPISFTWDFVTGNVTGGYWNEVYPATTGVTYYNIVTSGTVTGNTVNLTFDRTNPNANHFTFTGTLVGGMLTGQMSGPYLFTATGHLDNEEYGDCDDDNNDDHDNDVNEEEHESHESHDSGTEED